MKEKGYYEWFISLTDEEIKTERGETIEEKRYNYLVRTLCMIGQEFGVKSGLHENLFILDNINLETVYKREKVKLERSGNKKELRQGAETLGKEENRRVPITNDELLYAITMGINTQYFEKGKRVVDPTMREDQKEGLRFYLNNSFDYLLSELRTQYEQEKITNDEKGAKRTQDSIRLVFKQLEETKRARTAQQLEQKLSYIKYGHYLTKKPFNMMQVVSLITRIAKKR